MLEILVISEILYKNSKIYKNLVKGSFGKTVNVSVDDNNFLKIKNIPRSHTILLKVVAIL